MAFFKQLQLLLWKNGLAVIRQPLWSLTLVTWPLIIFLIIAVTRNQFPPLRRETCYVAPRNLPSTGVLPFLQTLMCNTDSTCRNTSRLVDHSTSRSSRRKRSTDSEENLPLGNLFPEGDLLQFSNSSDVKHDADKLLRFLQRTVGRSHHMEPKNDSLVRLMDNINTTHLQDQTLKESANLLKRAICLVTLPLLNTTSPDPFTSILVTFCNTNNTLLEVTLDSLNQILTELMLTDPGDVAAVAGLAVMWFDQIQNETVLWETLLGIPQLFSAGSVTQVLSSIEVLLAQTRSGMYGIQNKFPETGEMLSVLHPVLDAGINLTQYIQKWPGKDVYIPLEEVLTLNETILSSLVKFGVHGNNISLDQAIGLMLDKDLVHSFLCERPDKAMWLEAGCSLGTLQMVLDSVDREKVLAKVLVEWSKHVAPHDVSFVKSWVYSLMGAFPPEEQGGSNATRARRSADTQPANTGEELFLHLGKVVLDLLKLLPNVEMIIQRVLDTGFQSMGFTTQAFDSVDTIMENFLFDAGEIQMIYQTLLTNQSDARIWIDRVMNSLMESFWQLTMTTNSTCDDVLVPFEWLLDTKSVNYTVWSSLICQNDAEALLVDWKELIDMAHQVYDTLLGTKEYNVTLPMLLSQWHDLVKSWLQLEKFPNKLAVELNEEYWMNWIPRSNTRNVTETLEQSFFHFLVNFGAMIEKTFLWQDVKDIFSMAHWVLNYKPGITTAPPNCSAHHCESVTPFNWPDFIQAVSQFVMSPSQESVVNFLKGSVVVLQHVYSDLYTDLATSSLKHQLKGGEALSAHLINLMKHLEGFVKNISHLPDQDINDPAVMQALVNNLVRSIGLAPLLPAIYSQGPLNVSTVIDVASKLGRLNQDIFTFNETDPTMPELEWLMIKFLTLEGNLTMSLSHIMGYSLLTYSGDFQPDKVAYLKEVVAPYTNQTSKGLVEAILTAMEILHTATSNDITDVVLQYLRELQKFGNSLFRLQLSKQNVSASGNLSQIQVTNLSPHLMDLFNLLTPERLQELTEAGPNVTLTTVFQKVISILPTEVQPNATHFLKNFRDLLLKLIQCIDEEECLSGVSEVFKSLDQIIDMMLAADGNASITLTMADTDQGMQMYEEIISTVFSLLLSQNDAVTMGTVKQILHFMELATQTPNVTVSSLQRALIKSNLTIQDLNDFSALAGSANVNELLRNVLEIASVQQCYDTKIHPVRTGQCVAGVIDRFSVFLTHLPALRNETDIVSLISLIVNKTLSDIVRMNFSSSPYKVLGHTLSSTLTNIRISLQMNQLNTSEIMNELQVFEGLAQLLTYPYPYDSINATEMEDAIKAQAVYLEIMEWYLKRLENITSTSSAAELLQPYFHIAQMQLTVQLVQTELSGFISNQIQSLMHNLQYPITASEVLKIGQVTVDILRRLVDAIWENLEFQNAIQEDALFNKTILLSIQKEVKKYISLIEEMMKHPNVSSLLTNMLQWGNTSMSASSRITDLQDLLQMVPPYLSKDQTGYITVINSIIQSLNEAITVAEQTGDLQSEQFSASILEAGMIVLGSANITFPWDVQQELVEILQNTMTLISNPNISFAQSRNISVLLLNRIESVIPQLLPSMAAEYLVYGVKVILTYFESTSDGGGPDKWNQLILDEMRTIESFLSPNSTEQAYVSTIMKVIHFILESGQGTMSLWAGFENPSEGNLPRAFDQVVQIVNMLLPLVTRAAGSANITLPPNVPEHLVEILQEAITLFTYPNISFAQSRNISILLLNRIESVIPQLLPSMAAEYLVYGVKVILTYFESTSDGGGPDKWNQLILDEMRTIESFLSPNSTEQAYVSTIIKVIHFILESGQGTMSLWAGFENPSEGNLPRAFDQVVQIVNMLLPLVTRAAGSANITLPPNVPEHLVEILQEAITLFTYPNISFAQSRNISILLLNRIESVIPQLLPSMAAEYLVYGVKVILTYFESTSDGGGPDKWNQLILDEMRTIESLLSPNSTEQAYVSSVIKIIHFILESGQGNMSLWAGFENLSEGNPHHVFKQIVKIVNMLWPLVQRVMGTPSTEGFPNFVGVMKQIMTGEANQDTWKNLGQMMESLLWMLKNNDIWDEIPPVVQVMEKIAKNQVMTTQAENEMIRELQKPLISLIGEIGAALNGSYFNITAFLEGMRPALVSTMQAAQRANGTLTCSDVLKAWEPVGQTVGLSQATMDTWCNVHLQQVLDAHAAALTAYSNLNMSDAGVGPFSVSATADRIVNIAQWLYHVNENRTQLMYELFWRLFVNISKVSGQTLKAEASRPLLKQLKDVQLQQSLMTINMLSKELLAVAPFLRAYISCLDGALNQTLNNFNPDQITILIQKATEMFQACSNLTSPELLTMVSEKASGLNGTTFTNAIRELVALVIGMESFEESPMVLQTLQHLLHLNETNIILEEMLEMFLWVASTEDEGLALLRPALTKISSILRSLVSVFGNLITDEEIPNGELFEELSENIISMIEQLVLTGGILPPMNSQLGLLASELSQNQHSTNVRRKRDTSLMMTREPIDDLIDLIYIDYRSMFKAISTPPTSAEILETAHMMFKNPDLSIVVKGFISDSPWGQNHSEEIPVDAVLEVLGDITLTETFNRSSVGSLLAAFSMLPDFSPFTEIKDAAGVIIPDLEEILNFLQQANTTVSELFQMNLTDPRVRQHLNQLRTQVCALEETQSVKLLMSALSMEAGLLCHTVLPSLQGLYESLLMNTTKVSDIVFLTLIGDPKTYKFHANWTSVLSQSLNFNMSSLRSLNIQVNSAEVLTVGEILRDENAFVADVHRYHAFGDSAALQQLLDATLPNNIVEILSWLIRLNTSNCGSAMNREQDTAILEKICSMSAEDRYTFSLLMIRHLNFEKFIYRTVLSEDTQSIVGLMLQVAEVIVETIDKVFPALGQFQSFLHSMQGFNLASNRDVYLMSKRLRSSISGRATFVTLSQALCRHGIVALLGIAHLPPSAETAPSSVNNPKREEMIERFKIPRDTSAFCMDMYLDMVNTTGGAIAWAFLKPMLMGDILYTPDTPITRSIMKKANDTLQEFADLQKYSRDWLDSSKYVAKSAEILSHTLPMLQNSLGNSFVRSFIEMQTGINVGRMKETLSNFSNMTLLLEENKSILNQISTLSKLMVNLSSCIKFDRYRGYNSADQLNHDAQELAKNRELYASVLFNLPKDSNSSTLPPKVSYTIRMHMDNVMRTDRVRKSFFMKDPNMLARLNMRYSRGFIYLQENLDRAIIDTQAGQRVSEPAVQLQPFPYPCHYRDEFLEAISFVFPLMLMIAWVLFVADFVKKLVHERELRLHEYMKMMGVNQLSHFCAWFLECAAYLTLTIFILTLVLKYGHILPNSDGFLIFLYFCDYGLSVIAFSFLISSFFDKTYIAGLSGSLLYIVSFFPFIVVMAVETRLTFAQKSALSLFSPTCFSYASQYASRYESQGEGIHWSNSYVSPIAGDSTSFGWLCWLMLIDSMLYFILGGYIRMVFPGKYGIAAPWYFPFKRSFWSNLCGCIQSEPNTKKGLFLTNILQENQPVFPEAKGKGQSCLSSQERHGEDFSKLPVGVALHGLTKIYGEQAAIENLNISFYEGHVTSLLGHNGAGKTTTMSILTGLFAPSSGIVEVYGRDMQLNIEDVRKELGVCMQYDVLFDHMTTKEHLLLYGQIKAPHWSRGELHEQVNTILQETDMYAHRHKRVGTLSGGMRRKLSISIAFIGGSRLVVLDEPTTGVDPCSRRSIWDIVIHHKKNRTIIMSTHHLDEAEVLSDRIAFLERGGLKCCGSPFYLKDKLGQGYKLTLSKKMLNSESKCVDGADLKDFIQAHVPEARLKESQGGDLVYSLPPFTSANASSYRSLLTALDSNLDALQLGGYGISDTTLEEVFLQLTGENTFGKDGPLSISETISDSASIDSFPSDLSDSNFTVGDNIKFISPSSLSGMALAWQQLSAILVKRFHRSRRDWKGLISQILLPVLFVLFAMGLGSIKSDLQHFRKLELSPALYNIGPNYAFFRNHNSSSNPLVDTMLSLPGLDNTCLDKSDNRACRRNTNNWASTGNRSKPFRVCKCTQQEQICDNNNFQPPHKMVPSSQTVYNLSGIDVENYLVATANDFIRNRYGGFEFGQPLPSDLQTDIKAVAKNRTLSKVWFNPEGHHTMPAYLNSLNNFILRANLPADKDPSKYAISISSHPYFGRPDDEDAVLQGMLQILVAMCVLTGFSITTASFAIYEVNEHHSGAKRLQHIAGIGEPFYWIVNFVYDMALYMIPVTLTVAVVAAFQIPAFNDRQNLAAVTLLLVLFGFATFPWMYLLSDVFKDAETAFITYICINLFISTNTIVSTAVLHFISQISLRNPEAIKEIFNKLCNVYIIFPQFNFGHGLMQLARNNIDVQLLIGYGIDAYKDPFSYDGLGWVFIASLIQGLVFLILRLLLNRFLIRKVSHLIWGKKTVPSAAYEDMDEDVVAEHLRVSSGAANSDILQVNQLTKIYQNFKNKVHAVKQLSVGIPAGECFGLLGENGAGKTTTFKMLTGDVSPTDGTAQIRDRNGQPVDIMECRRKGINIGYCPQVDALDELLTGEEHLYFYARIRGIAKRQIDGAVNYLLKKLELNSHRNTITESYSCGTRRKLSTALALIGHPQILLLDEPSSGMDPRTKRHLWKIISEEVKGKCAVVLTSHSMEECEALCSRLAIMVKGQFQCLGSLQHIKNRFGSGFTVKMYLADPSRDAEAITDFMQRRFPTTYLKDQHSAMVEYHVPFAPGGVADIFNQLESNKSAQRIKHFSVSQTTLDEVFINFAMGNIGMQTIPVDDQGLHEGLELEETVPI